MSTATAIRTLTPNQQERRARILGAARDLVARHGYHGMIMRDVATRAKVSPTTLYNLYNTKDELLLEALRDSVADSSGRAAQETEDMGYERLLAHLHFSVEQTREEPAYAKAITQALVRAEQGDQITLVLFNGTRSAIAGALTVMRDQQQLHPKTQIEPLANALLAAFWGNYILWSKGELALEELESELKRSFLSLLLPVAIGGTQTHISNSLTQLLR